MTMNARKKTILAALLTALCVPLAVAPVQAQAQAQAQRLYTQAELDQMLAPIALYPDALLSQVLMAATYPVDVVEAARWSRANPGLQGDDAVRAVGNEDWDPSVKSLVAFPQILQRMDESLDWTRSLGEAFIAQEPQVMEHVQQLRRRAQAAGNLRSDEQLRVEQQGPVIVVQPASPQYVYVPYYDPLVMYGPWWWPAYRPVVWAPWPGYARPYRPGISAGFWWGRPIGLSLNFFFGDFDWHRRHVRVAHPAAYYYRPRFAPNRAVAAAPFRWQHESRRREDFAERRAVQSRPQVQVQSRQQVQVQAQPAATSQLQPQVRPQPRRETEPRIERREERREERQAARVQVQPQARPQSEARPQPQARPQPEARPQPQARPQPEARPQHQARPQPEARPQPQLRQAEQRPSMPAAQAPQTPRADRQEQRQERREQRQEHREERGRKAG